jgi:glycosyltransferase involved in cell wall biosynthesis
MNHSPKISVIIPTYNSSGTIGETLNSVFSQTFKDFEVILINDGSTDDLNLVLQHFQDVRLKVFHYPNGGLAIARNRGIKQANGKYLAFLDADDLWHEDKLKTHVEALEFARKSNSKVAVAYSWSYFLDHETQQCFDDAAVAFQGNVLRELLQSNFITSGSNILVSREAVLSTGFFNQSCEGAADWDYWLRLAQRWEYILIPERQVFYRQTRTSMSSHVPKMEQEQIHVLDTIFPSLPSNLQSIKPIALSNIYFYSAQLYSRQMPSPEITAQLRKKLFQAIVAHPGHLQKRDTYVLIIKGCLLQALPRPWSHSIQRVYRQFKRPQLKIQQD